MKLLPLYKRIAGSNRYPESREFALVAHTQVDDLNEEYLKQWRWSLSTSARRKDGTVCQYAMRAEKVKGKTVTIFLHRVVLERVGIDPGEKVDHIDCRDTLNNQLSNLRASTNQQSRMNMSKVPGSSRFRGVYWNKARGKWRTYVCIGSGVGRGKQVHLGYFSSEIEAAKTYDRAAKLHFDDRANLNFPEAITAE